jgi:nucleoside-diphosphate-sugar epimerase
LKVIVTGGAGFIGSNVVDKALERGWDVKIIDNLSTGFAENLNSNCEFINADICDYEQIERHFEGVDVVFHLAALPRVQPSIDDPLPYNKVNIEGTLSVLDACKNHGVKKIVFSSSSSIYGECGGDPVIEEYRKKPLSPYALQKLVCEQYFELYSTLFGINSICLRYFNVYGNRQPQVGAYVPVVGIFFKQLAEGLPLTVTGDGEQARDFVNVLDVAEINIMAAESNLQGYNYFNVGTQKNEKIIDIAKSMCYNVRYVKKRVEPKNTLADIQKAKTLLGWKPKINLLEWIKNEI